MMEHRILSEPHRSNHHPLPASFGRETYGLTVIGIDSQEVKPMERDLVHLLTDQQILTLEWEKIYKQLRTLEHSKKSLPLTAQQQTRDSIDADIASTKQRLLVLQEQRDAYFQKIEEINQKTRKIHKKLQRDAMLENLRLELTEKIRQIKGDQFKNTPFDPSS